MATRSSIIAWKVLWTEEPGGLKPVGSQTVRQDCVTQHTCIFHLNVTASVQALIVCFLNH